MMRAKAGAAGLLAVFAFAAWAMQPKPALDMTTTSAIAPAGGREDGFRLVSTWDETGCSLVAGPAAQRGGRTLSLAPGCIAPMPHYSAMRVARIAHPWRRSSRKHAG